MSNKKLTVAMASMMAAVVVGCSNASPAAVNGEAHNNGKTELIREASGEENTTDENAEAVLVTPNYVEVDGDKTQDGIYPAEFTMDNMQEGSAGLLLTLDLFTEDTYDIVDINQLSPGDSIEIDGKIIKVESVLNENGCVRINGGLEEGGVELRAMDESNCYRYFGFDDISTYTYHFTKTFPIDKGVVFADSSAIVVTETAQYDNLYDKMTVRDFYNRYNTKVRIENGYIVEIDRIFVP